MKKITIINQGMLKILLDIYSLIKNGKQIKAIEIRERTGLELKHWVKLTKNNLIINIGTAGKPIYKWDAIIPNIYMAIETLKDIPKYQEIIPHDKNNLFESENTFTIKEVKFIPPTLEMVEKYCNERKFTIYPSGFMEYYNKHNWTVGNGGGKRTPMKDWKKAVHTWEQNTKKYGNTREQQPKRNLQKQSKEFIVKSLTPEEMVNEFKRRGYTGNILPPSNEIKF